MVAIGSLAFSQEEDLSKWEKKAYKKLLTWDEPLIIWDHLGDTSLDSIRILQENKKILQEIPLNRVRQKV